MDYFREKVLIVEQSKIANDIYQIWFESSNIAKEAKPGQFINVYCKDSARLLPRPFGISQVNQEKNLICFIYKVVGEGTKEFTSYVAGDFMDVMGPLGNGYTIKEKKAILVGGGTGIPIMAFLAKRIKDTTNQIPTIVIGYRDELFLVEELKQFGELFISTEDGSFGTQGNVIDAIKNNQVSGDIIYACGPHPMLKALKQYASENCMEAQISLEEKMACGIGACLACTCKSKEIDEYTKVHNKRICKEGPVFDVNEVEL